MADSGFNLAIETSSATSSLAVGRGGDVLDTRLMPRKRRHNVELLPTLDTMCQDLGLVPRQLAAVYVSIGPGSFTGLRVGITIARMLARTTGCRLVAVPTLEVLARSVPKEVTNVAVALNLKRETVWSAVYDGDRQVIAEPTLRTMDALLAAAPDDVAVLGDPLPDVPGGVNVLPAEWAVPDARHVYAIGHRMAGEKRWADPGTIAPLYAREPEAVTLWNARHGSEPA